MRHFLGGEVGPARSVARLPRRLKPPGTKLDPIASSSTPNGFPALLGPAANAKTLPPVTAATEVKLSPATPADDEPIAFQRQRTPGRQFLDMELGLW